MGTINEEAQGYEPLLTKNIADLPMVSVNSEVVDRKGIDKNGIEYTYKVIIVAGEDYRVPNSVLKAHKEILKEKPTIKSFKVTKTGEGLNTSYTVIPLE